MGRDATEARRAPEEVSAIRQPGTATKPAPGKRQLVARSFATAWIAGASSAPDKSGSKSPTFSKMRRNVASGGSDAVAGSAAFRVPTASRSAPPRHPLHRGKQPRLPVGAALVDADSVELRELPERTGFAPTTSLRFLSSPRAQQNPPRRAEVGAPTKISPRPFARSFPRHVQRRQLGHVCARTCPASRILWPPPRGPRATRLRRGPTPHGFSRSPLRRRRPGPDQSRGTNPKTSRGRDRKRHGSLRSQEAHRLSFRTDTYDRFG